MSEIQKPFSQTCENNKVPILVQLSKIFSETKNVLEIGSGTGQHAVYFSEHLPHTNWHPTDREENIPGIQIWMSDANLLNLQPPNCLDVSEQPWPISKMDGVFSANTAHIMSWQLVKRMFMGVGDCLLPRGHFCLYGPFNYHGGYTSDSNARFDVWLKQQDSLSGIRDIEAINKLASNVGLDMSEDIEMPANNRMLVWRKID